MAEYAHFEQNNGQDSLIDIFNYSVASFSAETAFRKKQGTKYEEISYSCNPYCRFGIN